MYKKGKDLKNIKASIIIANYNSEMFIKECIDSLVNQSYKNLEIIFFDDSSTDKSLDEIKKFSNVKVIENNNKKKIFGSFNQMNAYINAFKKSTGEVIFFLDSDDYFHSDKIKKVIDKFNEDKYLKVLFDLPFLKFPNKIKKIKNKNKFLKNYWPYIPPQSCIAIKKEYLHEIFEATCFENFSDIWLDFRIAIYSKYIFKNFTILKENLTYYRQTSSNISSKFIYLSPRWWRRRLQAHKYINYFFLKYDIKYKKNFDYIITLFLNKFF